MKLERPQILCGARGRPPGHAESRRVRSLLLAGATTYPSGRGARAPSSKG